MDKVKLLYGDIYRSDLWMINGCSDKALNVSLYTARLKLAPQFLNVQLIFCSLVEILLNFLTLQNDV